jgi:hypothetical protein
VGADQQMPHPMVVSCGDALFVVSGQQFALASSGSLRALPQRPQPVPRA